MSLLEVISIFFLLHCSYSRTIFPQDSPDLGGGVKFVWTLINEQKLQLTVKLPLHYMWVAIGLQNVDQSSEDVLQSSEDVVQSSEGMAFISIKKEMRDDKFALVSILKTIHVDSKDKVETINDLYGWTEKGGRRKSNGYYYFRIIRALGNLPLDSPVKFIYAYGDDDDFVQIPNKFTNRLKTAALTLDDPESFVEFSEDNESNEDEVKIPNEESEVPGIPDEQENNIPNGNGADVANEKGSEGTNEEGYDIPNKEEPDVEAEKLPKFPSDESEGELGRKNQASNKDDENIQDISKQSKVEMKQPSNATKEDESVDGNKEVASESKTDAVSEPQAEGKTPVTSEPQTESKTPATSEPPAVSKNPATTESPTKSKTPAVSELQPDKIPTETGNRPIAALVATTATPNVIVKEESKGNIPIKQNGIKIADVKQNKIVEVVDAIESTKPKEESNKQGNIDSTMLTNKGKLVTATPVSNVQKVAVMDVDVGNSVTEEETDKIAAVIKARSKVRSRVIAIKETASSTPGTISKETNCTRKPCNCNQVKENWYDVFKSNENTVYFAVIGFSAFVTGLIVLCLACCCARRARKIPRTKRSKVAFYKVDDFDSSVDEEIEFLREEDDADMKINIKDTSASCEKHTPEKLGYSVQADLERERIDNLLKEVREIGEASKSVTGFEFAYANTSSVLFMKVNGRFERFKTVDDARRIIGLPLNENLFDVG